MESSMPRLYSYSHMFLIITLSFFRNLRYTDLCPGDPHSVPAGANQTEVLGCACKYGAIKGALTTTVATFVGGVVAIFALPFFAQVTNAYGTESAFDCIELRRV